MKTMCGTVSIKANCESDAANKKEGERASDLNRSDYTVGSTEWVAQILKYRVLCPTVRRSLIGLLIEQLGMTQCVQLESESARTEFLRPNFVRLEVVFFMELPLIKALFILAFNFRACLFCRTCLDAKERRISSTRN